MAAAEVSSNPYQTHAADEDGFKMNQEESLDDHDRNQQDGLGQIQQQQQEQKEHQQSYQEDFHEDSDRPETPNERSQTPDYKSESPDPARAATPDTAGGDAESFEDDKETDDYYNQATQQALLQQELQKLKDEGILPQSDEPVFDYDIAERVKQLNAELEQEGATPEKTNRRIKFSDSIVAFAPSPDLSEDKEDRTEDQMDPNDLEVARLTLNDDPHQEDGENGQRLPGDTGGSDVSASGDTGAEGLPNGSIHLDRLSTEQNGGGASNNTSGTDQPDGVNSQTSQQSDEQKQDEQVLLERNGQFELVNVKDLSAEERFMMGLEPVVEHNSNNSANSSSQGAVGFQPSPPPRKPRPSTATGQAGVRRQQLQPQRIQSAKTHREVHGADGQSSRDVDWDARSSGYGMSPEQKAGFRKAYRMQLQRQREEQERQEEEKRREKEESEEAFQWWLNKKREDDKQKRKDERERKKKEQEEQEERDPEAVFQAWVEKKKQVLKEEREKAAIMEMIRLQEDQEGEARDPDETYKAWLDNKKEQAKFERQLRRKMEEEKERAFYVRDRKDCDKAYKEWLRSKNSQLREEKSMKRSSASQSQKRAKLSRKSRQLAKALQVAETYRYTDYYGYRF